MFAVIMGMSAFAPAAMAKPNVESAADSGVCHFDDTDTQLWEALWVNSAGQLNAHVRVHLETTFTTDAEAFWCVDNQDGTVVDPNPPYRKTTHFLFLSFPKNNFKLL